MANVTQEDIELFNAFKDAQYAYLLQKTALINNASSLVDLIEYGFSTDGDGAHSKAALELLQQLDVPERARLFSHVLTCAIYHNRSTLQHQEAVLSFPRAWLVENIERYIPEAITGDDDSEGYDVLINLLKKIDHAIALRVSHQAAASSDEDVRQLGIKKITELTSEQHGGGQT